jgi:AraC family transcriptional regulator, regulatory protein of adaptative response / DNA-3-methyladenine glycosylase II
LEVRALDRARVSRDPRFDGRFFIAVTSTGIYCRPICPVRSPKRANIRYFETAAAAAAAGFRPCLRCRPEAAPGSAAWLGTSAVVRRALRLIEDGALDGGSVSTLAACVGIGPRHLNRLFARYVGASPITVAQTRRLHFAKTLIDETALRMTDIALAAGFGSLRRFNATFQKAYGRTPRELRKSRRPASADHVVLKLAYRPPYDWEQVCTFLAAHAIPGVERVDDQGYARTLATRVGHALVRVRPITGEHALELRVTGVPPAALFDVASTARRMFDLAADPLRVVEALGQDPLLMPLVKQHPGLRIVGAWDPFECAVRAALGEQVNGAATRTLAARLVARSGLPLERPSDGLTHLFPSPEALVRTNLQGLGLSHSRINTLRALARATLTIDFSAPPEKIVKRLAAVNGVGMWTAQYVALRALGEPDAFPTRDLVLPRITGEKHAVRGRPLCTRAEAWRPWRGYAAFHLWGAANVRQASE